MMKNHHISLFLFLLWDVQMVKHHLFLLHFLHFVSPHGELGSLVQYWVRSGGAGGWVGGEGGAG